MGHFRVFKPCVLLTAFSAFVCVVNACNYGPGCLFACHCKDGVHCDPDTGACSQGCDTGNLDSGRWYGPSCQVGNIAFNKSASQLGLFGYNYASNAVDGDPKTCAHPSSKVGFYKTDVKYNRPVWWLVDLGSYHAVEKVIINYREGTELQIGNTSIFVGNTSQPKNSKLCSYIDYSKMSPSDPKHKLSRWCKETIIGRYIKIQRSWESHQRHAMVLCEVYVLGYQLNPQIGQGNALGSEVNDSRQDSRIVKWTVAVAILGCLLLIMVILTTVGCVIWFRRRNTWDHTAETPPIYSNINVPDTSRKCDVGRPFRTVI